MIDYDSETRKMGEEMGLRPYIFEGPHKIFPDMRVWRQIITHKYIFI